MCKYLDDLVELGLHGDTRSDVARALLTSQLERLIKDGFLELKKPHETDREEPRRL